MADKQYPSDKQDKFMLRLPDGMRDLIKKEAEQNGRSMNAEIVHRLHISLMEDLGEMQLWGETYKLKHDPLLETRVANIEQMVEKILEKGLPEGIDSDGSEDTTEPNP